MFLCGRNDERCYEDILGFGGGDAIGGMRQHQ